MGFNETFKDTMKLVYDAPERFWLSSALTLISICAGRKAVINTGISKSIVDIVNNTQNSSGSFLNLWFMFIGKSRDSRKSTVLNIVHEIIQCVRKDVLIPPIISPEKLIEMLSTRSKEDRPESLWIYDECSGFFQDIKKQRMASSKEILSTIYNCKYFGGDGTLSRGKNEVKQSYLNVLMASTEYILTLLDENYMHQGFANRFIYVYDERTEHKGKTEDTPPLYDTNIKKLISWLQKLEKNKDQINLIFDDDALALSNQFGQQIDERISTDKDDIIYQGWIGNMPDYVDKLSAIFCLSDFFNENNENDLMLLLQNGIANIEKKHVQMAIDSMWRALEDYKKIVQLIKAFKNKKPTMNLKDVKSMIKLIIRSSPNKEIRHTDLRNKIRFKIPEDFNDIIEQMIDRGVLESKVKSTGGRKATFYNLKT